MITKLAFGAAVFAAFAGAALVGPAQADVRYSEPNGTAQNVAAQNGNTQVCGNRGVGDVTTIGAPLVPIVFNDNEAVNCQNLIDQP